MDFVCYNSYLEINLKTILENARKIQKSLNGKTEFIPVLKCNAYGFGSEIIANLLYKEMDIKTFGVAQIGEGIKLRKANITLSDILVLGAIPKENLKYVAWYNIMPTVFNIETANILNSIARESNKKINIHIKIETGLNRLGLKPGKELEAFLIEFRKFENLKIVGAFTHFLNAETSGSAVTKKQFELYLKAIEEFKKLGITDLKRHVSGSAAFEWFEEGRCDAVRIGRRLYMENPDNPLAVGSEYRVSEACSWKSTVINIRNVKQGDFIGYGEKIRALKDIKVAIVGVGYGDGLYPLLGNANAPILIKDIKTKIISICMDQCFVDVTDAECTIGDEVTFFGYSENGTFLSSQEVAKTVDQEGVNLISMISNRVEKRYVYQ